MSFSRHLLGYKLRLAALMAMSGFVAAQSPEIEGVWSTTLTIPEDEAWRVEDYGCFVGCLVPGYDYLRGLINDPANDARPFELLTVEAWAHQAERLKESLTEEGHALREELSSAEDPACRPLGLIRLILGTLPIEFVQSDERVTINYEEWEVARIVHLDEREHPAGLEPSPYGYSVGYYEDSALVIETRGISADRLWEQYGGGGHSDQLQTVERYRRSDDGVFLMLELTLSDPVILREPLVYEKVWRYTPDVRFHDFSCE